MVVEAVGRSAGERRVAFDLQVVSINDHAYAEGREAIGAFFDEMTSLADATELRLTGPIRAVAGECAFPMQARPTMGGTTMVIDIIDVMTFDDDGRITTMRAFWDPAEMRPADD